ncbi:MAG: hypothetical protein N838_14725 [Thiohalocapsa sp. PB-PSB1]|nr:MAG: hypothetical protein N838_14725 [Thiohalocapsa sp. PB-PSB1]
MLRRAGRRQAGRLISLAAQGGGRGLTIKAGSKKSGVLAGTLYLIKKPAVSSFCAITIVVD